MSSRLKLQAKQRLLEVSDKAMAIKHLQNQNKQIRDMVAQLKDWNTAGQHDEKIKKLKWRHLDNRIAIERLRK